MSKRRAADPTLSDGAEKTAPRKNEVPEVKDINRFQVVAMISCLSLMAVTLVPSAQAQGEWNKKTTVTFSEPVEVPGVGAQTLPAGTYVFRLVDSASDRNIVRILSPDGTHVYTTILAIANYRLQPTDKTVMTFRERAEGQPQAIRAWFYPGDQWGQEFVYPKTVAVELAKATGEPVLAMPPETEPTVTALESAPVVAVQPTGDEAPATAEVEAPPAQEPAAQPAPALPRTASEMPLLALLGLLLLSAGFALSVIPKRAA